MHSPRTPRPTRRTLFQIWLLLCLVLAVSALLLRWRKPRCGHSWKADVTDLERTGGLLFGRVSHQKLDIAVREASNATRRGKHLRLEGDCRLQAMSEAEVHLQIIRLLLAGQELSKLMSVPFPRIFQHSVSMANIWSDAEKRPIARDMQQEFAKLAMQAFAETYAGVIVAEDRRSFQLPQSDPDSPSTHSNFNPSRDAVQEPLFCQAVPPGTSRIAIIGNGPLTEDDQMEMKDASGQVVIRMNALNNRLPGEATDIWIMRHATTAEHNLWGLAQMEPSLAEDALNATRSFWFLMDLDNGWIPAAIDLKDIHEAYPSIPSKLRFAINAKVHHKQFALPGPRSPSTGWLGLALAAACNENLRAEIHLYGFNFHEVHAAEHPIKLEQALINQLIEGGMVTLHPTACSGVRSCQPDQENERDCHLELDSDGHQQSVCGTGRLGFKKRPDFLATTR